MAATSLFLVREALHDLYGAALANVGVELLPAVPTEAEDVSERVLAWWSNEVDVTAQPYTMPNGLVENYQQLLVIKVLPADSDVTARPTLRRRRRSCWTWCTTRPGRTVGR